MNSKILVPAVFVLMGVGASAWADDDDAEATIRLMGAAEVELPEAVTKKISLPDHLRVRNADQAATVEQAKGHDKANERLEKREQGLSQADRVREHGADMSEKAKEARENSSRGKEPPEPPDRPETPNQP